MPLHVFFPCFRTKTVPFPERESCVRQVVTLVYTSSVRQASENNLFKFVPNNGKGVFIGVVSRISFLSIIHHSLNHSVKQSYFSLFVITRENNLELVLVRALFNPHIQVRWECLVILSRIKNCEKKSTHKKKN